jgi:hypothetical protein
MFVKDFFSVYWNWFGMAGAGADKTGRGRSRWRAGSYEVTKISGP